MAHRAPPPPAPETVLRGHSSGVQALCFVSEHVLLTGSQDGIIKVWNLERRRTSLEVEATVGGMGVQRLDLLNRSRVVSQGRDGLVKVWDTERLLARSSAAESDASWRDGDDEGTAQRQQKQPSTSHGKNGSAQSGTSNPEPVLERVTGAFHFCQFALTRWREEVIPTASESETDRQGYRRELFDDCKGCVDDDAGRGGDDDRPRRTDVHDTGQAAMGDGAERNLSSGSFAENAMLAPSHEQHSAQLWDLRDTSPAYAITPGDTDRKGMLMCLRLLGESSSCASPLALCGHDSGYLCVYDLRATSSRPLMETRLHEEPLLCLDVGSSCTQGVSGSADHSIHVFEFDPKKGRCETAKTFRSDHPGTSCVEIRRDQKLFVSGGWDHRVRAFSWKRPRPLAVLRSHEGSVYSVAHSPRLGGLASGSADSRIAVWNVFAER